LLFRIASSIYQYLLKGGEMFEVSEKARQMARGFLKETGEQRPIRIVFTTTECDQPALGMALSESQEGDEAFDCEGVSFIVDGQLYQMAAPIQIDLAETPAGTQLCISCSIAENTCHIAQEPDSCRAYCMTCTCQDEDPLAGLVLHE
jgi:Fe-S cluster assembly iron-binding protein IscA